MNFLYVDESGTPGFNDPDQVFSILGLDVDESKGKDLIYGYNKLKKHYFPRLHNTPLSSLPTIKEKIELLKKREIKGILTPQEFCYPHRTFMFKVINLCTMLNVKLFNITAFKDKLFRKDPEWLYPVCLQGLTRVYNRYLSKKGTRGIIVMDSRGQTLDDAMTFNQSSYLLWSKKGKQFDKVIDLPFFASSHLSMILQIAHFFAYITASQYRYVVYNEKKYSYIVDFWTKISSLLYGLPKGDGITIWA